MRAARRWAARPRLDRTRYQTCVDVLAVLAGPLEEQSWRRAAGARAAVDDEDASEVRDTAVYCLCGERCAMPLDRAMHWAVRGFDGRDHGLPPDERERVGVAWLLLDEETGRVLRAGCKRLPATSEDNDYSTKSEGEAVLEAIRDLLPGLLSSVKLVASTDSLGWKVKYERLADS